MKKALVLLSTLLLGASLLQAKVTLPSFFSDNMVFQQNSHAAIWGWSDSGRKVTVSTTWSKEKVTVTPGKDGKWMARIQTPSAGGPYEVKISDGEAVILHNVLVGEVWFCSGQSNMQMPVKGFSGQPVEGSAEAMMSAKPQTPIRICTIGCTASLTPLTRTRGSWKEHTAGVVAETSATAYFFARQLQEALDIPVGIIISSWGGSTIETWIDEATIRKQFAGEFNLDYLSGQKLPEKPNQTPCTVFNGQVHPLIPFTFKGMIWYQGEANRHRGEQYIRLQKEYVAMMRDRFENPEAPFYFVQIAPYRYDDPDSFALGFFCEAQEKSVAQIPHSGMATTLDVGELGTIHPSHKQEVGRRLAMHALVNDYGLKGFNPVGPTYKSVEFKDGSAIVTMEVDGMGLAPNSRNLTGFEVAGEDRVFHPAVARAKGDKVTVQSPEVPHPVAVRYGFRNWTVGTLFNNYGVPAGPFRTDDWDSLTGKEAPLAAQNLHDKPARETPSWFREGLTYQVMPRSMSREGTLKGAEAHLERLRDLGVNTLYLMPVNVADTDMDQAHWSPRQVKSGFNDPRNPYRAADYFHVDPEYGTDQDLKDYVNHAHSLGMKVLLDLVFFHCGPGAQVLKQHPEYFQHNEDGSVKFGQWRFPVFDFSRKDTRDYLHTVMAYYVADFNVDGYRLDVADMIPLDFWEDARTMLEEMHPGIVLVAEGTRPANTLYAFDADYGWAITVDQMSNLLRQSLTEMDKCDASQIRKKYEEYMAKYPKGTLMWNFTENHDISTDCYPYRHEQTRGHDRVTLAKAFTFALDGVPFLVNGEEVCYDKTISMFGNKNAWIDWKSYINTKPARERTANIKAWVAMRKQYSSLTRGETVWIDNDQPKAVVSFRRHDGVSPDVLFVGNYSDKPVTVNLSGGKQYSLKPWGFIFQPES